MATPEERLDEAATLAENASAIATAWANGPENTTVSTESGPLPTIAEFLRSKGAQIDNNAALISSFAENLADVDSVSVIAGVEAKDYAQKYSESISVNIAGAIGNGVANDTAAFESIESSYAGRFVDLLGKIYLVDRYFSGCNYFNGSFRVIGTSIPTTNFSAGKEIAPLTESRSMSDFTLKAKSNDARYTVQDGLKGAIVLLGDSISHGAFQGELYRDGWVNVFKRMSNAQTGCKGYGFAPLLTVNGGSPVSNEVHDVNFSGGNAFAFQESTSTGQDVLQGLAVQSSQAGDSISISCPTFQSKVRIWFIRSSSGGTFSYSVNSGAATNVSTSGANDLAASVLIDMTDNRKGRFNLTLTIVSGTVRFTGVGYEIPASGSIAGNVVQNFSQSGRRLRTATEAMIETACKGSVLMLCLGHNDSADITATPALASDFSQRIDWIIKYCLKYNTSLVIPDFCWQTIPSDYVRKELRRASAATKGLYIPLPEHLYRDQMLKTEYTASYYQVDTLGFFVDPSHPSAYGAKWIAESIATALGFSVTSKREAFAHHDFPWPVIFAPASQLENNFTTYPNISFVKRNGDDITMSLRLKNVAGVALAAGTYQVSLPYNATNSRQIQFATAVAFDTPTPMGMTNTNAIFFGIRSDQQLGVYLESVTPYVFTFNCSMTLPLISSEEY